MSVHGKRSFFNEHWQELESKTSEQTTYFVWGIRYIDDLILREKGQEKLYVLHDPNLTCPNLAGQYFPHHTEPRKGHCYVTEIEIDQRLSPGVPRKSGASRQ